ncbi:unnamed protein product [Pylaiella littoralis]
MISLHNCTEYAIFTSYSVISLLVLYMYVRHAKHIDTRVNRMLVVTAGFFLMLCACTHLHNVWYDKPNIALSVSCALVSSVSAALFLLTFRGMDDYLSFRVTTLCIIRDKLVRDLGDGYDLRGVFCGTKMTEGYIRDDEIALPVEFTGALETNSTIQLGDRYYRVTRVVEASVDVGSLARVDEEAADAPFVSRRMVFGYDATAEVHMAKEQERMDSMRMAMCMSTAHDVRTPLSSLGFVITCLRCTAGQYESSSEYERLLDEAFVYVEMINLIVTQFMEIGNMESTAEIKPTISFVDVKTLHDRIEKVGSRLAGESVSFSSSVSESVPPLLFTDADWIWQIILNLVSNAAKYTFTGQIDVSLRYAAPFLIISVTDTGIGIRDKEKNEVFERFVTKKSFGHDSHGIGLYSVKMKVEYLKGFMEVRDNPGGGSVFEVRIPVVVDEGVNLDSAGSRSYGKKSCLIVDDTPSIRKMMKRLLGKHDVDVAVNGAQGLEMMKEKCYDIVLLDMFMPVMDGLECISRLRSWESENGRARQVIYSMSANSHGVSESFDGCLPKPIDGERLAQILERL